MPANLPTVSDLPTILKTLQDYPFATIALLVAGWLVVEGIKHFRGGKGSKEDKQNAP